MTATRRVAFVLPSFAGGGAQKVILALATNLDAAAFTPIIIVLEASGPWISLVPPGVRVVSLETPRLRNAFLALRRALRVERPDIVVSTIGYLNIGVLLLRPFLKLTPRIIVREANTPRHHTQSQTARVAYRLAYRYLYRHASRVVCPATYLAEELVTEYGIARDRITVLPNPVDEVSLRAAAVPSRRVPGDGPRFIAIGRLTEQKGYDRLLEDFARLPPGAQLTIFGEGELQAALERQIERLGLKRQVALAGFEPQPAPWLAGADALLLSSRWEGLPNVALEALACGVRVIATPEAGGIGEIAECAELGAVTIVSSGSAFVSAMMGVTPQPDNALRTSLLPETYRLHRVADAFAAILVI